VPEVNEYGQRVGDQLVPTWTPCRPPEAVHLPGRYVALEPLSVDHAPALYAALCGAEDRSLWTYRPTEPPADVAGMVQLIEATLAARDMLTFALVPSGEAAAGIASYMRIDPTTGQVEIAGVLYARRLQRTTAATEAIHLAMRYAFDELGYRRFEWRCGISGQTASTSRRSGRRPGWGSPTRAGSATTW
jgi:RimJ/RimL family protein N-acetyltransferase